MRPFTVVAGSSSASTGSVTLSSVAAGHDGRAGRTGEVLQPLRHVHGVADERVLEALLGAEQGGRDVAGRHADAHAERWKALACPTPR